MKSALQPTFFLVAAQMSILPEFKVQKDSLASDSRKKEL